MLRETKNEHLKRKYGSNIINDFTITILKDDVQLATLSTKYGFSREWARRLFQQLNSSPYNKTRKYNFIRERNKDHKEANRVDPTKRLERLQKGTGIYKGTRGEVYFYNMCKKLGLKVVPLYSKVDFEVNGKMVEFKTSSSLLTLPRRKKRLERNPRRYYHFGRMSDNEWKYFDYLVCLIVPYNTFFVLPKKIVSSRSVMIPSPKNPSTPSKYKGESKYLPYKNAWHLLS